MQYEAQINAHAAAIAQEETKRIQTVNETVQISEANKDPYVRRMRPTFGYAATFCMVTMFLTVVYTLLKVGPEKAIEMIKAYAQMEWIIVAMLAAIGVYIKKRSDDKKPPTAGLLGIISSLRK